MTRVSPLVDIVCNLRADRLGCDDLLALAATYLRLDGDGVLIVMPPFVFYLESGDRISALGGDCCED